MNSSAFQGVDTDYNPTVYDTIREINRYYEQPGAVMHADRVHHPFSAQRFPPQRRPATMRADEHAHILHDAQHRHLRLAEHL